MEEDVDYTQIRVEATPRVLAPPHLEGDGRALEAALGRVAWAQNGVVFASSGSGGGPKWVLLSRGALSHSAREVNRHLGISPEDCWFLALPAFHVGGFGVLVRAHEGGCEIAELSGTWDPAHFVRELAETGGTHTSLVPAQVYDLVEAGLEGPPKVRAVVVGGGGLSEPLGKRARELGWPVLQSYGMTEAGSQVATAGLESLGEPFRNSPLPVLPHWDVRVGGGGVLELRGPALFKCYVTMEAGQAQRHKVRKDGWFTTTDLVELHGREMCFLGRSDRIVKVLGELVNLSELESRLVAAWGGEIECRVLAVEDERSGRHLCPVFENRLPDKVEDVLARINAAVPGFSRLGDPRVVGSWPRTPVGKVDYLGLEALFVEERLHVPENVRPEGRD